MKAALGLAFGLLAAAAFGPDSAAAAAAAAAKPAAAKPTGAKPAAGPAAPVAAQAFKDLAWRPIGPANMGGRVSAFAVVEKRPATFYAGFGTGGVFKTTNLGTTWSAVFEKEK